MDQVIHAAKEGLSTFQVLWEDGERRFCRGVRRAGDQISPVLTSLPVSEHPSRVVLERLAHEFAWRDDLDTELVVRPLELHRHRANRVAAGGFWGRSTVPRSRLISGSRTLLSHRDWRVRRSRPGSPARFHPQGHQASPHHGGLLGWNRTAHRFRHRVAPPARAPSSGTTRFHRGYSRIHGARAERAHEPLDRCPK
jgi:hypothetical protein